VLLGKGPQPDNRFHSKKSPYKGPQDAIRKWIEEGEQVVAEVEKINQPYQTRGGRQPVPRRIFSHTEEVAREKELRAQAKIEAQRKLEARDKKKEEADVQPVTSTAIKPKADHKVKEKDFFKNQDETISPIKKSTKSASEIRTDELHEAISRDIDSLQKVNAELRSKTDKARASLRELDEISASSSSKDKTDDDKATSKSD
jgi:predicted HNH restriction endonuclease